ncbi:MAG: TIGR04086 family membrane protein [Bacillota bacterium]
MTFKPPATARQSINFTAVFRGIVVALVLSVAGSFIIGLIYHLSGIRESTLPVTSSVLLFLSVLIGGLISSRHSGSKGLIHGLGVGIFIFILIWLLSGLFLSSGIGFVPLMQKLLVCLAGGSLGGIIGVSL